MVRSLIMEALTLLGPLMKRLCWRNCVSSVGPQSECGFNTLETPQWRVIKADSGGKHLLYEERLREQDLFILEKKAQSRGSI